MLTSVYERQEQCCSNIQCSTARHGLSRTADRAIKNGAFSNSRRVWCSETQSSLLLRSVVQHGTARAHTHTNPTTMKTGLHRYEYSSFMGANRYIGEAALAVHYSTIQYSTAWALVHYSTITAGSEHHCTIEAKRHMVEFGAHCVVPCTHYAPHCMNID